MSLYAEFQIKQKQECFIYCNDNACQVWQKDLNKTQSKILVADSYDGIYNKILQGYNNFYEYWLPKQPLKFYIDFDCKISENEEYLKDNPERYITDIKNIINHVKTLLGNVSVSILKSIPENDKISFHLIFDGRFFTSHSVMKSFVEEMIKPNFRNLFDKKIFDTSVYGNKCFRTLYSTKHSSNRILYIINYEKFINENIVEIKKRFDFQDFLKSCITYIDKDNCLYNYKANSKKKPIQNIDGDLLTDKDIVKQYIDLLDPERYNDRNKWLNVGYILHSINSTYEDLWHYFSSKWDNYNKVDTTNAWNSFSKSEFIYTINNLRYLVKKDNPDALIQTQEDILNHDIQYLRDIDCILSKFIYRQHQHDFCCSDSKTGSWYYYNGKRWVKEDNNIILRKKIIDDMFDVVNKYTRDLYKNNTNEDVIKRYTKILKLLGNGKKLNSLDILFHDPKFEKIINQNNNLIGFENGVYDLENFEFREGRSDDYITLSTGYDYGEYDISLYSEVSDLLYKILPDPDIFEFTLKSISTILDGYNRDENFYIWAGKNAIGGNGKTTLMNLITIAMGEYAYTAPVSLITSKRESSNSANSSLYGIKDKRVVIMTEPSATDKIQVDVLKSLTGGDEISTREMYSMQINFIPKCKFFMACNKLPPLSGTDGGTSRRIKVTEFTSKFLENPDTTKLNEFQIDYELKDKLKKYSICFFHILLHYYKKYRKDGLLVPESIKLSSIKYQLNNNIIKQFVDENIIKDTNAKILKSELVEIFSKNFVLKNHFNNFQNFLEHLSNELNIELKQGKDKKPYLKGVFIKTDDYEDEDGENDEDDNKSES